MGFWDRNKWQTLLVLTLLVNAFFVTEALADPALAGGDRWPSRGGYDLEWDEEDEPRSGMFAPSNAAPQAAKPEARPKAKLNDFQRDTNILDSRKSVGRFDDFFNQTVDQSPRREDLLFR